jgi:hypothetical protein
MTVYRRDETGKVYADGGIYGIRGIDDARSDREDFHKMMERRASELPRRRLSPMERLAREEELWGFDSMVARRLGTRARSATRSPARRVAPEVRTSPVTPSRAGMLVAIRSFVWTDPRTRRQVRVTADRTNVARGSDLHRAFPQAFAA